MSLFSEHDLGNLFAADDFDLAALGLMDMDAGAQMPQDDAEPHIPPTHDMESLEFFLWMEEEVDKEQARRRAAKQNKA